MRRSALSLVCLGLAALGAAVALASVGGEPGARAAAISSSGAFQISNSREGAPIFTASGIAPGGSATGTVVIGDEGADPVSLVLSRHDLVDVPGSGGGVLSERLTLTVTDVTDAAHPRPVYAGPLATMPDQRAGRLEAGAARTYEFVATLPATGTASFQNAVQGASTSVAYSWTAVEAEGEGEKEEGGGGGGGGGGGAPVPPAGGGSGVAPAPVAPVAPVPPGGVPATPRLELALSRAVRSLRGGRLVVWAGCQVSCRIAVSGRLRASVGHRHRAAPVRLAAGPLRAGTQRLRIVVPRRLRRWVATQHGRARLRARLVLVATDAAGERATLRRSLRLRR